MKSRAINGIAAYATLPAWTTCLLPIDHLDAAKLPLNGHALALFKAKRGVHQPNGVLAVLLWNQA